MSDKLLKLQFARGETKRGFYPLFLVSVTVVFGLRLTWDFFTNLPVFALR